MNVLLDRRRFIARSASIGAMAAIGLGTTGLLPATTTPAAAQGKFRLFDATRFAGKPDDLAPCGLEWIRVLYSNEFWPTRDWAEPDLGYIEDTLVPKLVGQNPDRLVLDIEHWELDEIDKLVTVIQHMRKLMPGVRLGYYSLVPTRDYWAFQPGKEGRRIVYGEQTKQWGKLVEVVDDLYPTLYAFYDDQDGWMRAADGTIASGKEIGKPMYPFLWPQYHDKNKKLSLQMIQSDFWRAQLDKVRDSGCDGTVIWGTLAPERRGPDGKVVRLPWDPKASWWLETQDFARQTGLATSACA